MMVRILGPEDAGVLRDVASGVFDHDVDERLAREFLATPNHHLAVAIVDGVVVGMASGVTYVHPDKPRELWVNEVGVAPTHRRKGIASRLLDALLTRARELGCREAWVLTEADNVAARRLYRSFGGVERVEAVLVEFGL